MTLTTMDIRDAIMAIVAARPEIRVRELCTAMGPEAGININQRDLIEHIAALCAEDLLIYQSWGDAPLLLTTAGHARAAALGIEAAA